MQIRVLAGLKRLMMVLAIASLIVAPARAAAPMSQSKSSESSPMVTAGGVQDTDDSARPVERVLFARSNYVWPFSSGPVYGNVSPSNWTDAGVLHTQVGSFDLTKGLPNLPTELQAANKLGASTSQYFLLQVKPEAFTDGSFDVMRQQIVATGGAIIGEMPIAAFTVRMTQAAFNEISTSSAIVALVPYPPAFKLSPEIGRTPLPQAEKAASSVYSLELQLFPGENVVAVVAALKAMGLDVKKNYEDVVRRCGSQQARANRGPRCGLHGQRGAPLYLLSEETTTTVQTGRWNNGATPYNDAGSTAVARKGTS